MTDAAKALAEKLRTGPWQRALHAGSRDADLCLYVSDVDPRVTMEERLNRPLNRSTRRFIFTIPGAVEVAERAFLEGNASREAETLEKLAAWILEEDRAAGRPPP